MAFENLKLTQSNFVRVAGYFYTIDHLTSTLYKKVDSGENAFTYPLDTGISNPVLAIQHDGTYFYTLECVTSGNGTIVIRKWLIQDFILKLQRTYPLSGSSSQKFDTKAFAIENYRKTMSGGHIVGSTTINLNSTTRLKPGDVVVLGPSTDPGHVGKFEEVVINTIAGNTFSITAPGGTVYAYNSGDPAKVSTRCWFFNQYRVSDSVGNGQLYSFDLVPLSPLLVPRAARNEFKDVVASTYLNDPYYPGDTSVSAGPRDFLVYMKQTNLLFLETDDTHPNFLNSSQSATQNNQKTTAEVITVNAITHENSTLFRLQTQAKIRTSDTAETDVNWNGQYNYQLSTLRRIPTSISLTADPAIIAADGGTSSATVTAILKDQFDVAITGKLINFTDDDSSGFMLPTSAVTGTGAFAGIATVSYKSGTTSRLVTITATTT